MLRLARWLHGHAGTRRDRCSSAPARVACGAVRGDELEPRGGVRGRRQLEPTSRECRTESCAWAQRTERRTHRPFLREESARLFGRDFPTARRSSLSHRSERHAVDIPLLAEQRLRLAARGRRHRDAHATLRKTARPARCTRCHEARSRPTTSSRACRASACGRGEYRRCRYEPRPHPRARHRRPRGVPARASRCSQPAQRLGARVFRALQTSPRRLDSGRSARYLR